MKDVIKLLKEGAPVSWRNTYGWTSLHVTCVRDPIGWHDTERLEVMKVLLRYKANVNQQNDSGETPLHYACANGLLHHVEILLGTGQCDLG